MAFRQVFVDGASAVAMRAGELEVVVQPADGGRIANLRRGRGREWLRPGRAGGWVERLTAAPVGQVNGAHERLHAAVGHHDVADHVRGVSVASDVPVPGLPLLFRRELTVLQARPAVQVRYALVHTGGAPIAWIWHPLIVWTGQAGTAVHVPGLHQVRVGAAQGRDDLEAGDFVAWPGGIGGDAARFRLPESLPWSLTCHGDLGSLGRLSVTDPRRGEYAMLFTDTGRVPHVGLAMRSGAGELDPPTIAAAPRIGLPDDLAVAVALGTAPIIEAGEERVWGFEIRLGDPELDEELLLPDAEPRPA
jgi:hypothetical protein